PDIYVETKKHKIACEFQSARIARPIIQQRNEGYIRLGIQPIWFIGANQLQEKNRHSLYINAFLKQFIYQFHDKFTPTLYIYCPHIQAFIVWSYIYPLQIYAYRKRTIYPLKSISFSQLFSEIQLILPIQRIISYWKKEKLNFRLNQRRE